MFWSILHEFVWGKRRSPLWLIVGVVGLMLITVIAAAVGLELGPIITCFADHYLPFVDASGSISGVSIQGTCSNPNIVTEDGDLLSSVEKESMTTISLELQGIGIGGACYAIYMGFVGWFNNMKLEQGLIPTTREILRDILFHTIPLAVFVMIGILTILTQSDYSAAVEQAAVLLVIYIPMLMFAESVVESLTEGLLE